MFTSKTILPIAGITLLVWSGREAQADVLQITCSGTDAAYSYAQVTINADTYYADKYGKVTVPNIAALAGKNVIVLLPNNQRHEASVRADGVVTVPCR